MNNIDFESVRAKLALEQARQEAIRLEELEIKKRGERPAMRKEKAFQAKYRIEL